jgi:carbon monoxide dehydrogenase subunit G
MSFKVKVDISKEISLSCDFDKAFDVFADVRKMAKFFPKVESLTDLGGNSFKWNMEKMGISKYSMAVEYAAKYVFNKNQGLITWTPVAGIGNGANSGSSKVRKAGDNKTVVNFSTELELDIPFTSLAKPIIKPFVESQFKSMLEKFEANIIAGVR